MLIQRRRAQATAFAWALSLDGSPVTLRTTAVKDSANKPIATAEAVQLEVISGSNRWSILVNPQQKSVIATRPNSTAWQSAAAIAVE
jgi:hypothetical protein